MQFIDTHSHIYGEEFTEDIDQVIVRAQETGVSKILLPNVNRDSILPMLKLCIEHPDYCYPMIGLHPEDIKDDYRQVLDDMHTLLFEKDVHDDGTVSFQYDKNNTFIAIGEVGLDYYWDRSLYDLQQEVFEEQIGWAIETGLPLMIHTRSAHEELLKIMKRHANDHLTGIFHCFAGTADEARELLQFEGFALGIGGVLTFKKSPLPEALKDVPLDRLVIETDAPYLAPVPMRGKRNEPAFAIHTLNRLAELYNTTPDAVAEQTNQTVLRIMPKVQTTRSHVK